MTPSSTDILVCFLQFDRDSLLCLGTHHTHVLSAAAKQAKLCMSFGGLGLHCMAIHAPAAYIASVSHANNLEPTPIDSTRGYQ